MNKHRTPRNPEEIISEINVLLRELSAIRGTSKNVPSPKTILAQSSSDNYSGPSGGLRLLVEEGFFNDDKSIQEVIDKLHQEGYKYPLEPIAVALLRMVKKRILVRLQSKSEKGRKIWVYAKRK